VGKVKKEKTIAVKKIFSGRLLKLSDVTIEFPHGQRSKREIVEHPGAVAVVALTADRQILLIKQYRKPTEKIMLEIPAGVPGRGERWIDTARRELEEETGWRAGRVRAVWAGFASPGYSTEVLRFFLAENLTPSKQQTDHVEFIEVVKLPVKKAFARLIAGKIDDNKTMIGIMIAQLAVQGKL
jgi:ADP-ribose pyrophosphatase